MKHFLLLPVFLLCFSASFAQNTPGPAEQKITNNICDCITKLDLDKINNKAVAEKAFTNCFSDQTSLILQVAEERKIEITDQVAMQHMGSEIAKNLMRQDCKGFMRLAVAMAGTNEEKQTSGVIEGQLKRIETKDFNYFVLVDGDKKERSFIWLRQFTGSENVISNAEKLVGKKIRIGWQDMEVYVPAAKNYYTIKEITGLEVL